MDLNEALDRALAGMRKGMDDALMQAMTGGAMTSTTAAAPQKPLTIEALYEMELELLTGKKWKVHDLSPEGKCFRLPACPPASDGELWVCHPTTAAKAIAALMDGQDPNEAI